MKKLILAQDTSSKFGTTIYRFSRDDVSDSLNSRNIVMGAAFDTEGWNSINFKNLPGSEVINNILYLLVTDGHEIEIEEEFEDPEDLLRMYRPDQLEDFIEDGTEEILKNYVTFYEMDIDLDEAAYYLIHKDNYSFTDVLKAADDINLLNDYL